MVEVFRNVLKYSFHYHLGMERPIHQEMTAVKKFVIVTGHHVGHTGGIRCLGGRGNRGKCGQEHLLLFLQKETDEAG